MIRLLVGLGNPGPDYDGTRHNAGFAWVDAVARQLGAGWVAERAYQAQVARVNQARVNQARPGRDEPLWLLKPMTYMNLSGRSVAGLAKFYKIAPCDILVVHDELDLLPGQMKLKQGGGAAGHNGLKDILAQLGSPDFWRLRLGIGHPGVRDEVAAWVLRRAPSDEREATEGCIARSLETLDLLLDGAMDRAMMKIHPRPAPAKPAKVPGLSDTRVASASPELAVPANNADKATS